MTKPLDKAFAPIISEHPRVLILGSMPSQLSLSSGQYYGNPNNAFWWIMSEAFGFDLRAPYAERCQVLTGKGVAVWDVIEQCHRPGSLDSAIDKSSVRANCFDTFLSQNSSITTLLFNGQAAHSLFKRHMGKDFLLQRGLTAECLPSTSPAHASVSREQKLEVWKAVIEKAFNL